MRATWKPHEKHGDLTERGDLPDSVFAYPRERKEPMTDASHVRNAIARFDQVGGVSDDERDLAFANIKKAARHYGVSISEADWPTLGRRPRTGRTTADRKRSARKASQTRKRRGTGARTTPARKRGAKRAALTRKKNATSKASGARKKAARKTTARKTTRKKSAAATTARKTTRKKTTRKKSTRKKTTRKKR